MNQIDRNELIIRSETLNDIADITHINDEAFQGQDEGKLVSKLRGTSAFIPALSLIAENSGEPIGYILFSQIAINDQKKRFPSLALAPMAVIPSWQGKGVGSHLIREGLTIAAGLGHLSVIVLGHPKYYPRFGFLPAINWNILAPFTVPDEAFMALELIPGGLEGVRGIVEYPQAFEGV